MPTPCSSDSLKAKIKLFHHGEIVAGINERLGDEEINTLLSLIQEEHDEKERMDKEKDKNHPEIEKEGKKKGKKG